MTNPLPLYPGTPGDPFDPPGVPCVGSGFCCKQAPCPFGERTSDDNPACKFLVEIEHDGTVPRYTCGIYDDIIGKPGWQLAPAFGAGCCSNLNGDRQRVLAEIRQLAESTDGSIDGHLDRHHRKHIES